MVGLQSEGTGILSFMGGIISMGLIPLHSLVHEEHYIGGRVALKERLGRGLVKKEVVIL